MARSVGRCTEERSGIYRITDNDYLVNLDKVHRRNSRSNGADIAYGRVQDPPVRGLSEEQGRARNQKKCNLIDMQFV